MKGNIEKLAVLMIIAAIAMFMSVGMASADHNNWKVTGEYAVTAGMSCLFTPFPPGFTNNATPTAPAGSNSITLQGIFTFNHDGTGRMDSTGVAIFPPPAFPNTFPHASAFHFSFTFTYDVTDDNTITIDADENSFQVTYDTGPGFPFTADKYSLSGVVSGDHKTLTLGSPTTLIQTMTIHLPSPAPPVIMNMICNGSYVLTRLGPIERGGRF